MAVQIEAAIEKPGAQMSKSGSSDITPTTTDLVPALDPREVTRGMRLYSLSIGFSPRVF